MLVILFLLYTNQQILPKDSVLGKMLLVAAIIYSTHTFGKNTGLLMTAVTIIVLHNTKVREYFGEGVDGEDDEEGEEGEEGDEEGNEEEGEEGEEGEDGISKMNKTDLEDTIQKSPFVATMEAGGEFGGNGMTNRHESGVKQSRKEAQAVETSKSTSGGAQENI